MNQSERDAYQIAENTPKERHSMNCKAMGVGALISKLYPARLCNCYILNMAKEVADKINKE